MEPPLFHGHRDPPDIDTADYVDRDYDDADHHDAHHDAHHDVHHDAHRDAFDLEDVNRLASEQDYELVYFSKESGLVSFEPAPVGGIRSDDDDDDGGSARINVYWTTGIVGTYFDHPTRGRTQLFRRDVDPKELAEIFRNPRVHAGRSSHYEAQDDASSSPDAPIDGDGDGDDVALLQETNQMLREQLNDTQRVEITGPRGEPVYAAGSFRDGRWTAERGGLWGIDLAAPAGPAAGVPVSALEDVEIRLGGVLYASALSHEVFAGMDDRDWDGASRKEVSCHFGGPVTGAWLPVRIDGWPRSHWSKVQGRDFARRRNEYRKNLGVYDALLEEASAAYPGATLSFHELSLFGGCVEQLVDGLGIAPPPEEGGEGETWDVASSVVAWLRSAGCDDVGEALARRVDDVRAAAHLMLAADDESKEAIEAEIPALVQLQLDSRSTADFLSEVRTEYGIQLDIGASP